MQPDFRQVQAQELAYRPQARASAAELPHRPLNRPADPDKGRFFRWAALLRFCEWPGIRWVAFNLLAVSAKEEATGLEAVFFHNRDKLERFLYRNGGGSHTEDLLQDIWLKVSGGSFGPIDDPVSYLHRIAYNLLLNHLRGDQRSSRRAHDWTTVNSPTSPGVSDEPSAERSLIAREAVRAAQEQLGHMGEPTASIFRQHRIEGKTQRTIAREFGMGLSTVEKHLRKAYRLMIALKDSLDEA